MLRDLKTKETERRRRGKEVKRKETLAAISRNDAAWAVRTLCSPTRLHEALDLVRCTRPEDNSRRTAIAIVY